MARFKHRVIVEVTFDKRVTAKAATDAVRRGLSRDEMNLYGQVQGIVLVENIVVKEAERVIQGEINWRTRRTSSDGEPGEP